MIHVIFAAVALLSAYVGYRYGARAKAKVVAELAALKAEYAAVKAEVGKVETEAVTDAKAVIARIKGLIKL